MIINEEYLASKALSQSKLKRILMHPQMFLNSSYGDADEPKETTLIGDAVDLILTQDESAFDEAFYISDVEKPGSMMGTFTWELFVHRNLENPIQIAYEKSGFKIDIGKVCERYLKEGKDYYDALLEAGDRSTISTVQKTKIDKIVEALRSHPFTSSWIQGEYDIEVYKQVVVEFEYLGEMCKGLLDLVVVDRETDTLYPIDIKTTASSTGAWMSIFWKFRYDIQAAFYTYGVVNGGLKEKLNVTNVHPFRFIVVNQDFPGTPLIYEMSEEILHLGQHGGTHNNREYKGFHQAIEQYKWHTKMDMWEYPMEDYINLGVRKIK